MFNPLLISGRLIDTETEGQSGVSRGLTSMAGRSRVDRVDSVSGSVEVEEAYA